MLKNEKNDKKKKVISDIIYRLEFGKIDISEEGVKYLEKMYDLEEMNNSEYFVNRLTGNGDVGIFDEKQELLGYFNIREGLEGEEKIIHPEVMEFTIETLFLTKEGETEDEKQEREKYLQEFKENYFDFYDEEFVARTGTRFNNLDFKEQGQFLIYYKSVNEAQREDLLNFIAQHKENGLKSFLSLEQDLDMGKVILSIGEELKDQSEVADRLFAQYAEMVDGAENDVDRFMAIYNDVFFSKQINRDKATQYILRQAMVLLKKAQKELNSSSRDDKADIVNDFIIDLNREQKVQNETLRNLELLAKKLNNLYNEMGDQILGTELLGELRGMRTEMAKVGDTEDVKRLEVDIRKHRKYDSQRIKDTIETYKSMYILSDHEENVLRQHLGMTGADIRRIKQGNEKDREQYEPYVVKLEKLLKLQTELEQVLDAQIYGGVESSIEEKTTSAKVMQKYQEIVDQAKRSKREISELFAGEVALSSEDLDKISDNLLKKAKRLLDDYVDNINGEEDASEQELNDELERINGEIILIRQIVKQLPREEVAELNLRDIEQIDRKEDMPASELLKKQKILEQIKSIIRVQFPEGDDVVFEEECKNNKKLRLTITMANNEVVSFFSKERVSENVDYIDWFISNPETPIKGLGEATLRLGFSEDDTVVDYAVAKPHVKSFSIFVEKLGFVSFDGSTVDGEYKDHYARIRRLSTEKELETKKINKTDLNSLINSIKTICLKENKIEAYLYKGKKLNVCKIKFHGQTHKDDILETDQDGWIMAEIKRQYAKGNVLTRYIPENNFKDNQTFYAIFEKDNVSEEDIKEIDQVVAMKSSSADNQLDSKKVLRS